MGAALLLMAEGAVPMGDQIAMMKIVAAVAAEMADVVDVVVELGIAKFHLVALGVQHLPILKLILVSVCLWAAAAVLEPQIIIVDLLLVLLELTLAVLSILT
jgi:hypothetical protein